MKTCLARLFTALVLLTSTAAVAGGTSPNGKPFVEIQGQIVEVQGDVSTLEQRLEAAIGETTSLEERMLAAEDAILALQQETDLLEAQIAANTGDIAALQQDVASNTALIAALEGEVLRLDDVLQTKQAIVTGRCPYGMTIWSVWSNGSVSCQDVSNPRVFRTYREVVGLGVFTAEMDCGAGRIAMSGGFTGTNTSLVASYPSGSRTWNFSFQSIDGTVAVAYPVVMCLEL